MGKGTGAPPRSISGSLPQLSLGRSVLVGLLSCWDCTPSISAASTYGTSGIWIRPGRVVTFC